MAVKRWLSSAVFAGALLMLVTFLLGAAAEGADWSMLHDKTVAVVMGTVQGEILEAQVPEAIPVYYNKVEDCFEAVRLGKTDYMIFVKTDCLKYQAKNPQLRIYETPFWSTMCGVITTFENTELLAQLNAFTKRIQEDGTLDDMMVRWVESPGDPVMPEIEVNNANGKITFGTAGITNCFSYFENGEVTGLDVEYARRFALEIGKELEIVTTDFAALVPAVQAGKVEFAANMLAITEERKQSVAFTEPVYDTSIVVCEWDESVLAAEGGGWVQSLKDVFIKTLITDHRWKMLADGLGVTLYITVFALIVGTLLAFPVCFLNMSKNRVLSAIGKGYSMLFRGTPTVVLLMIAYYGIFASVNIDSSLVAIIAFGMNSSAYIGELLHTAILTVDKGEVEAARSMGFTQAQAFLTVILPQACRVALPVYQSEFIVLLKSTAVVGYIAVMDLTRAADLIRTRTLEAFFPLIVISILYLVITGIAIAFFNWIRRVTDKRMRRVSV